MLRRSDPRSIDHSQLVGAARFDGVSEGGTETSEHPQSVGSGEGDETRDRSAHAPSGGYVSWYASSVDGDRHVSAHAQPVGFDDFDGHRDTSAHAPSEGYVSPYAGIDYVDRDMSEHSLSVKSGEPDGQGEVGTGAHHLSQVPLCR